MTKVFVCALILAVGLEGLRCSSTGYNTRAGRRGLLHPGLYRPSKGVRQVRVSPRGKGYVLFVGDQGVEHPAAWGLFSRAAGDRMESWGA
jgi:hypothetical protein